MYELQGESLYIYSHSQIDLLFKAGGYGVYVLCMCVFSIRSEHLSRISNSNEVPVELIGSWVSPVFDQAQYVIIDVYKCSQSEFSNHMFFMMMSTY